MAARRPRTTTDLQVRRMPLRLRDELRRRAQRQGATMSAYVIRLLSTDLSRPPLDEWLEELARLGSRRRVLKAGSGAAAVRAGRAEGTR